MRQWPDAWPDAEPPLGFYRFDVTDEGISDTFIPLEYESEAEGAYGLGGHPREEERDYLLALEKPPEEFLKSRAGDPSIRGQKAPATQEESG